MEAPPHGRQEQLPYTDTYMPLKFLNANTSYITHEPRGYESLLLTQWGLSGESKIDTQILNSVSEDRGGGICISCAGVGNGDSSQAQSEVCMVWASRLVPTVVPGLS